jgi:hypothetical protein
VRVSFFVFVLVFFVLSISSFWISLCFLFMSPPPPLYFPFVHSSLRLVFASPRLSARASTCVFPFWEPTFSFW